MKKERLFIIAAFSVVIADQISKFLIAKYLQYSVPLIKNILHLTYIENTGAGFGLFKNMNSLLIWVAIIIIGIIFYNYNKIPKENLPQIMTGLIVGGAFGNLISRIFLGYVIDFIDFRIWPAFNIADSAITIGAIGLIIFFWKK